MRERSTSTQFECMPRYVTKKPSYIIVLYHAMPGSFLPDLALHGVNFLCGRCVTHAFSCTWIHAEVECPATLVRQMA